MKLQNFIPILVTDFIDADPWFHRFLPNHNSQMDGIVRALQKNLTFTDNFSGEIRAIPNVQQDTEFNIELTPENSRPQNVLLLESDFFEYHRLSWQVVDLNNVKIKVKWDTAPSNGVNCIFGITRV